jgi:hypothetical protein
MVVAGAAAVTAGTPGRAHARARNPFLVCRLKTRKTRACRACQKHHRYLVFRSTVAADANRAHVGCNCPIVRQRIGKRLFRRLFPLPEITAADLRRLGPRR